MKFSNKIEAIAFIEFSSIPTEEKITLTRLIEEHALDREIKVIGSDGEITSLLFEADHDVESHIELDNAIIDVHSLAGVSSVSTQLKATIMTEQNTQAAAQQLNEMEAIIAASMQKIMESSLDSVLEAALVKQQSRIDETVKKAVDEALKNVPKDAETKSVEEPKKPTPEQTKEAASGLAGTLGKTAAYLAGAAAIATGGYFAWQKWGGSSSTPAAE